MRCTLSVCCVSICIILKALIPLHLTSGPTAANCQENALVRECGSSFKVKLFILLTISMPDIFWRDLCNSLGFVLLLMEQKLAEPYKMLLIKRAQHREHCSTAGSHAYSALAGTHHPCFFLLCPHYTHTPCLPLWADGCFKLPQAPAPPDIPCFHLWAAGRRFMLTVVPVPYAPPSTRQHPNCRLHPWLSTCACRNAQLVGGSRKASWEQ